MDRPRTDIPPPGGPPPPSDHADTPLYRIAEVVAHRARLQAALAALGELAVNAEDPEPLLHAASATVLEMLAVDAAAVTERGDAGVVVRASSGIPGVFPGAILAVPAGAADAAFSGSTDAASLLETAGFPHALQVTLPGRDSRAMLGAYARGPRTFSAEDTRFLEITASLLASVLSRHRAEREVIERERRMRAVFDAALDGMFVLDDGGAIVDANAAAVAFFGGSLTALRGRRLRDVSGMAHAPADAAWAEFLAAGRYSGEMEVPASDARRWIEFTAIARVEPGRHLAVFRDVTERRHLQTRLALADRMASVGTLAAGVAHELNNPLAYVTANLTFVAERLGRVRALLDARELSPDDRDLAPQLSEALDDARSGAERMRVIIRDLKTFSRMEGDKLAPVHVGPVLDSCLSVAANEIRHRARLVKELAPVPPVHANEARLAQVFLNLLVNAAQAIPDGAADANTITVTTRLADPGRVAIEVRDTGCGIAAEHLQRIFDPFFTTKPPGVGTGLGLAICHGIVSSLGGEIEVESEPGAGSTFRVLLALAPTARRAVEVAREHPPAEPPRARILVVDDEPLVGTVIQRTFQREHDVSFVTSARAALERIAAGERYDVILTDLLMPELTGMDLFRALEKDHPALARRTVFLTGGAFTAAARAFVEDPSITCVEKPFDLDALRRALALKLSPGGAGGS